jgi:tetratricopeptide (TPR) repeat protein
MRYLQTLMLAVVAAFMSLTVSADPAAFDAELTAIQQAWDRANYETPAGAAREAAFSGLATRAATFTAANPTRAEPLIWEGIVLSSYAGARGGLGALKLAKQAREKLKAALAIAPGALNGSAYTSLGTLYYKVPGFPLGFGDDDEAQANLERALQLNPAGIDPNYFYGEFLYEKGDYANAQRHLQRALEAAPRPNREIADRGRRQEVATLLDKVRRKQG